MRFPGKAGEEVKRLEERETELLEEIEKHKSTVNKLKEDRTHYRKLADEYRYECVTITKVGFFFSLQLRLMSYTELRNYLLITEYPEVCLPRRNYLSVSFALIWNLGTVFCLSSLVYRSFH